MKKYLLSLLAVLTILTNINMLSAQCTNPDEVEVSVVIVPDQYADTETEWELFDESGNVYGSGTTTGDDFCISTDVCLTFSITDSYGDGIINGGGYEVYYDGNLEDSGDQFGYAATKRMGNCTAGSYCDFAFDADTAILYTVVEPASWYVFTAPITGQYDITTCGLGNTCNTAIWVFDYCEGLIFQNTVEGTYTFSEDGCGDQADLVAYLAAGDTYQIRIGSTDGSCEGVDVQWQITYDGPLAGCLDSDACNYNPLATVANPDEACIYPGDPTCPDGPDLIVLQDVMESSLYIDFMSNADNCAVEEGCLTGYNNRQLLRFTTHIQNIGTKDYYIGEAPPDPSLANEQWEWDACHGHWHYEGYAEYSLYDELGQKLPIGYKNGFCVIDLECSGGGVAKYTCGNQGISAGCGDIYGAGLSCQWIDITDLESGVYTLVMSVNWDNSPDALGYYETNPNNNWAQVCIDLERDADGMPSFSVVSSCDVYTDCLGQIYGNAQLDCEGNCAGGKVAGDRNADGIYTTDDVNAYLTQIMTDNTATICTDLNSDAVINVADAALLIACELENSGGHTHTNGSHTHCELPTFAVTNPNQTVTLSIFDYNVEQNYIDIDILNPDNRILAFQFDISGLEVNSVFSFFDVNDFDATISYNAEGKIAGVTYTETTLEKHTEATPFLRVFYSAVTAEEVCISSIETFVNKDYEETQFAIVGTCMEDEVLTGIEGISTSQNVLSVSIFPNPISQNALLTFKQQPSESHRLSITDINGKILAVYDNISNGKVQIDAAQLPAGMYFYNLSGSRSQSGKLVVR